MIKERRPTDDLQPGEHDAGTMPSMINLERHFKVWYIDRSGKDCSHRIKSKDSFSARAETMISVPNVHYVVKVTEIN